VGASCTRTLCLMLDEVRVVYFPWPDKQPHLPGASSKTPAWPDTRVSASPRALSSIQTAPSIPPGLLAIQKTPPQP
jgi:hypothetical protein